MNDHIAADEEKQDMELYRRSNAFDRVLTLYQSTLCSDAHRRRILELVHRFIKLDGGMTLTTRIGIENWFAIAQADGRDQTVIKELGKQLHDYTDTALAQQWRNPTALSVDVS